MDTNIISNFIEEVKNDAGVANKNSVATKIVTKFHLTKQGAVYYCDDFAVRFCSTKSRTDSVSNTVMALKHIKKFDSIPLFVCVVGPNTNYLRLANATFIKKVSHSSIKLSENNIVGNINYSDIMKDYKNITNTYDNYEELFKIHKNIGFAGNIQRIVRESKNIMPSGKKFIPTAKHKNIILDAPRRAHDFIISNSYSELKKDLDEKTKNAKEDIMLVESNYGHDVKTRGNLVEYFIKSSDEKKKEEVRRKIKNNEVIDDLIVENGLGDYSTVKDGYPVEIDIKSKVRKLNSAPKGYNVDKLLEFLSKPKSIVNGKYFSINFGI